MRFQPDLVTVVDDLRLDILLRMLKSPHFSAKMNSLKEASMLLLLTGTGLTLRVVGQHCGY